MRVKRVLYYSLLLYVISMAGLAHAVPIPKLKPIILLGTAGESSVYHELGKEFCSLINRHIKEVRCRAKATPGQVYNLNSVRMGELDLLISDTKQQLDSYKGEGNYAFMAADESLRTLMPLYSEGVNLLVRTDASIYKLRNLPGKRIDTGNLIQEDSNHFENLLRVKGWKKEYFKNLTAHESPEIAVCNGQVDGMFYLGEYPSKTVHKYTNKCDMRLVPVADRAIQRLVLSDPLYSPVIIPGDIYISNPERVPTLGVQHVLTVTTRLDSELIYKITRLVFKKFSELQAKHPVYKSQDILNFVVAKDYPVPLHQGAKKYYLEAGLW